MNYTIDDIWSIKYALKEDDPWSSKHISHIKEKIKSHYRKTQQERCCYCHRNIGGEFGFVLDIEHVLPKSIFKNVIFDLDNLAVSCKRCNMNIKRNKVDFAANITYLQSLPKIEKFKYFSSKNYRFIHPNLDKFDEHIEYLHFDFNGHRLIKYKYKTEKGKYTYHYFELDKFEIHELNRAQGIEVLEEQKDDDEIVLSFKLIHKSKS